MIPEWLCIDCNRASLDVPIGLGSIIKANSLPIEILGFPMFSCFFLFFRGWGVMWMSHIQGCEPHEKKDVIHVFLYNGRLEEDFGFVL